MTWTQHDHDPEMPNLVDDNPYPSQSATQTQFIHPPQNASYGGQPDLHAAFPGYTNSPWSAPASTPYPTYTQLQHNPYNTGTPGQSPYTPISSWGYPTPLSASGYPSYPYANTPNPHSHSQPQIAFYPTTSSPFGQPLTANSYFNTQPQPQIQMVRSRSRANSFSGPLSRPGSLRRSSSFGGGSYYAPGYGPGYNPGYSPGPGYGGSRGYGYTRTESYHSENLARRPREWRADFTMSSGISAYVPRLSKSRSTVQEIIDPTRRDLHPYLQYQNPLIILSPTQGPPISWDLRLPPFPLPNSPNSPFPYSNSNPHSPYPNNNPHSPYPNNSTNYPAIHLTHPNRPPTPLDYAQLTTHPPTSFMRLYHPRLPWYIDIVPSQPSASQPNSPYHPNASGLTSPYHPNANASGTTFYDPNASGITFYDLVTQLWDALMRPIAGKDFWNEEVGWVERERVTRAFWERCALVGAGVGSVGAYGPGPGYGAGVGAGYAGGGGVGGFGGGAGYGTGYGGGELGVDAGEVASGIRRIDFLRRSVVFLGLSRGRNGMWEIKTEKVG